MWEQVKVKLGVWVHDSLFYTCVHVSDEHSHQCCIFSMFSHAHLHPQQTPHPVGRGKTPAGGGIYQAQNIISEWIAMMNCLGQ